MDDQEERDSSAGVDGGPPLPHTPPLGIRAVRSGEDPPVVPATLVPGPTRPERPPGNWLTALVATGGSVFSIIGTFLPWRVEDRGDVVLETIGWDQGSLAVVVLLVGLVAAGATGALWAGQRGMPLKVSLLATGAVLFAVAGLKIADLRSVDPIDGFEVSVGLGLPVVLAGGGLLMAASLLDRGPWRFGLVNRV